MRERGIAILEAVGLSGILLTALISAFAVSIWIARSYALSHLLDRTLVKSSVAPSTIVSGGMALDHAALQSFTEEIADTIEQEIFQSDIDDDSAEMQPADYLIQVGYAAASFHPQNGVFDSFLGGIIPHPFTYLTTRGVLLASTELSVDSVLEESFTKIAASGSFPLAGGQFTSQVAFIGAAVFLRSKAGLAPYFFSLTGKDPILVKTKVVALRGGVGL